LARNSGTSTSRFCYCFSSRLRSPTNLYSFSSNGIAQSEVSTAHKFSSFGRADNRERIFYFGVVYIVYKSKAVCIWSEYDLNPKRSEAQGKTMAKIDRDRHLNILSLNPPKLLRSLANAPIIDISAIAMPA
jgi:hypothetical protein